MRQLFDILAFPSQKYELLTSDDSEAQSKERELVALQFLTQLDALNTDYSSSGVEMHTELLKRAKEELREVQMGTHPEYISQLKLLERARDDEVKSAGLFRDYQLECTQNIYQLEHETAINEYEAERDGLEDAMLAELEENRRALVEERESFDLGSGT